MKKTVGNVAFAVIAAASMMVIASCSAKKATGTSLAIAEQGFFAAGGTVRSNEGEFVKGKAYPARMPGDTVHGDHAAVFYQIPEERKENAIVFMHGVGQSGRCWGTTADGREGFQNLYLRDGYPVYLVDQPRRGQAGQSTIDVTIPSDSSDRMWFEQFRIGIYPDFYDGVQFPRDEKSIDQFFRMMTPNFGEYDMPVISDGMAAVFDRSGKSLIFTHSAGGPVGWVTATKTDKISGIVAFEPGTCPFPAADAPEPIWNWYEDLSGIKEAPIVVSDEDFARIISVPIIIYYGDYIPSEPTRLSPGQDYWRASLEMARKFAEVANKHGGDVTVVALPEVGITGNTHFPFSDLNNLEVKAHLDRWLHEKGLDK